MQVERHVVELTTASGVAVGYTPAVTGRVLEIHYVKDDFAPGVNFSITVEATGEVLWSQVSVDASTVRRPMAPIHASDGSPSLYAALGEPVEDYITLADDRVKISVAAGADKKHGTFHVVIG